ncbi:MAG: protein kinase [Planctomycetota bacterium]
MADPRRNTPPPSSPTDDASHHTTVGGAREVPRPPAQPTVEHTIAGTRAPRRTTTSTPNADTLAARYEPGAELGRGGMGVVIEAHDAALRRTVAVKQLAPDARGDAVQAFLDEAQITGQLEHPNIVPVHDVGRDADGRPWLVMKRIQGRALREVIAARKKRSRTIMPRELNEMLDVITRVGEALAFAHDRGVIHRDLKPDNVMVGNHGEVLLMDWGLARPVHGGGSGDQPPVVTTDRRSQQPDVTVDGRVAGTPAYMAPEQADGRTGEIGTASDIFGLGAILYHQLTLEPPYTGDSLMSVLTAARNRDLIAPRRRAPHRGIPLELDAIVMQAMAAEPRDRYRSVADLLDDIAAFRANTPVSALPSTAWRRLIKWTRRRPAAALGAALSLTFVLVLGLVVALLMVQSAEQKRLLDLEAIRLAADAADAKERADRAAQDRIQAELTARDAVIAEWSTLIHQAVGNSGTEMFLAQLTPAQGARYLAAYDRLFRAHREHGVPVTAIDYYHRAVLLAVGTNILAPAMEGLSVALEMKPDLCDGWLAMVMLRVMSGDVPGAAEAAGKALACADNPRARAAALCSRGSVCLMQGDETASRADVNQALREDADYAPAWTMQGAAALRAQQFENALSYYDEAVTRSPESLSTWMSRAMCRIQIFAMTGDASNLDKAHDDLSRAMELGPSVSTPVTARGMIYLARKDFAGALREFRYACAINPGDFIAWIQRAMALIQLKRPDEAREAINKATALCPPAFRPQIDAARRALGD